MPDQHEGLISLQELVESQRLLQLESFGGVDPADHSPEERARFITWNAYALEDEIHEVTGEVGWKPWATSRHLNRDAYLGELADALHFFMNLAIVADITGEELAQAYFRKRKVNVKRQEDGYDGVTGKDPITKRAMDEPELTEPEERELGRESVRHPAVRKRGDGVIERWNVTTKTWDRVGKEEPCAAPRCEKFKHPESEAHVTDGYQWYYTIGTQDPFPQHGPEFATNLAFWLMRNGTKEQRTRHHGHKIVVGHESMSQIPICRTCNRDLTDGETAALQAAGLMGLPSGPDGSRLDPPPRRSDWESQADFNLEYRAWWDRERQRRERARENAAHS